MVIIENYSRKEYKSGSRVQSLCECDNPDCKKQFVSDRTTVRSKGVGSKCKSCSSRENIAKAVTFNTWNQPGYIKKHPNQNNKRLSVEEKLKRKQERDLEKFIRDTEKLAIKRLREINRKLAGPRKLSKQHRERKSLAQIGSKNHRWQENREDLLVRNKMRAVCRDMIRRVISNKNFQKSKDLLGYSCEELKNHIESLWEP